MSQKDLSYLISTRYLLRLQKPCHRMNDYVSIVLVLICVTDGKVDISVLVSSMTNALRHFHPVTN